MKVCVISNTSWSIYNFRKNLIKRLISEGHEVSVMAPDESYYKKIISSWNCEFITLRNVSPKSTNPFANIRFYFELKNIFEKSKFDTVFAFTPKPNIWGAIASKKANINFIPTINGLGHAFIHKSFLSFIVSLLYKYAFSRIKNVVFQNPDDIDFFLHKKIVVREQTLKVAGSGVDLEQFYPSLLFNDEGKKLKFLYAGRFIKEKGVLEYVEASNILKKKYPEVNFYMVGAVSDNPSSISMKQIEKWILSGIIKYYALTDDMSEFLNDMDVLVFPSYYREGIPKVLLEACAKEIPIITTNNVGCNQVIIDNYNGFIVKEKSVDSLVDCMERMIKSSAQKRRKMGINGRKLVKQKFDENIVIASYMGLLDDKVRMKKKLSLNQMDKKEITNKS